MKKLIFILIIIAAAFAVYWFMFKGDEAPEGPKQQALTVNRHSAAFNSSIDSLLQSYFAVRDAFVDGDSLKAKQAGIALVIYINRLNLEELKKDTAGIFESAAAFISDVKTSAEAMGQSQIISDMRQDFKSLSENIYPLLKTIHYEGKNLYWQNCPTAFGPGRGANWISETEAVVNPYLGKNDPAYKQCGEIQDTIKAQ
ncbi:MAG: DUF3347 domain-containing protein [Chitinophagaceae bacterium]|nr:DUF3347 domain-containing protein [Chitinophagaceae bacterium]